VIDQKCKVGALNKEIVLILAIKILRTEIIELPYTQTLSQEL